MSSARPCGIGPLLRRADGMWGSTISLAPESRKSHSELQWRVGTQSWQGQSACRFGKGRSDRRVWDGALRENI